MAFVPSTSPPCLGVCYIAPVTSSLWTRTSPSPSVGLSRRRWTHARSLAGRNFENFGNCVQQCTARNRPSDRPMLQQAARGGVRCAPHGRPAMLQLGARGGRAAPHHAPRRLQLVANRPVRRRRRRVGSAVSAALGDEPRAQRAFYLSYSLNARVSFAVRGSVPPSLDARALIGWSGSGRPSSQSAGEFFAKILGIAASNDGNSWNFWHQKKFACYPAAFRRITGEFFLPDSKFFHNWSTAGLQLWKNLGFQAAE